MADKNSIVRFNPPELKRALYAVRLSPKVRNPGKVSTVAAPPTPSSVSSLVRNASGSTSRSAAIMHPDMPRAQDVQTSRSSQTVVGPSMGGRGKTVKTDRQELVECLKSPTWIISNPRGEPISRELKDAVSSLILVCRMLEKISEQLNNSLFKTEREKQHVEFLSRRLLKSWAAFSMAAEGYYDDEGWARSVISRTAFDMMEIVSDLQALLAYADTVLALQDKCREYDSDGNLPQYWLTRDAISRYQGVEKDLFAVMLAAQQLNETFSRLPVKKKAGVRLGDIVSVLPVANSPRKPVQQTGKPLFQQKHRSELESLNKQASAIYVCLGDLGKQLQLVELQRQFVLTFLNDSATLLKDTMQHAKTIKSWETGLHRSRHQFLKAYTKLQDIASVNPKLQPRELAIAQKVAASIYASFDSVTNIVLNLRSDGVTELQVNQTRQEISSSLIKTISPPTVVTRRYISDNSAFSPKDSDVSIQVGTALLQVDSGKPTTKVEGVVEPSAQIAGQLPGSRMLNVNISTSPPSTPSKKTPNAGARARKLTVAWQEIENVAKAGKQSSD